MVAGHNSPHHPLGIRGWTSTTRWVQLAGTALLRYRPRQDQDSRRRPRRHVLTDAFSEDGRRRGSSVDAVPGVRLVNDDSRLVPEARPFVWSAERDVVRVTLGGSTPLPAIKGRLLDTARASLSGVEVADRMGLARGAPQRFDAAALLLIDQIGKLKDGKITISDAQVSLSGMARDLGGREAIAATEIFRGFSVAANEIKAPPYIFQAYKDQWRNADVDRLRARQHGSRRSWLARAANSSAKRSSTSQGQRRRARKFYQHGNPTRRCRGYRRGTLVVSDREVKLSGDALYELPRARSGRPHGDLRGAGRPSQKFQSSLPRRGRCHGVSSCFRIRWPRKISLIGRHHGRIRRAARSPDRTALRCPTANIEIASHTDADGDDGFNQTLWKRAQVAVIWSGQLPGRFKAIGYGGLQPVAAKIPTGKAQNRASNSW